MPGDRLTLRELNRATLDRQLLLDRSGWPAAVAVRHLGGLQAQAPLAPYVGLWTRLAGFRPPVLEDLLTERAVLRAHVMRNTVHLVTAADYLAFRPLFQPVMTRALNGAFGRRLAGVDLAEIRDAARPLLAAAALTRTQLAERLSSRWPGHDPSALAYAATHLLPLVQVPPRGLWTGGGPATWTLADSWLAHPPPTPPGPAAASPSAKPQPSAVPPDLPEPPAPAAAVEQLVLRYLGAFGPATVADIQAWSGLSRLREVTERLGAQLRPAAGPDGEKLLDLPGAPRPGPDVPVPPRFLPEYDNLLLSFARRDRVNPGARPVPLPPGNGAAGGTVLVDGFWAGDWTLTRSRASGRASSQVGAVLEVRPFTRLAAADRDAVAAEGRRLLDFAAGPAAGRDVQILAPKSG
jgi:hypothetical protein